jgi:hypothetical protein
MYATITSLVLMYIRTIIPGGMSIPSPAVLALLGWGYGPLGKFSSGSLNPQRLASSDESGTVAPRAAVRTIQVDIQYVRGCHHWPEGVLNDKGLRVAEMAGKQLLFLYHLS